VARPDVRRAPAPCDRAIGGDGLPLGRRELARRPRAAQWKWLAQGLALVVVIVLWGAYLARSWEQLAGYQWRIASGLLGLAALGWAAYFLMLGVGWVFLVRRAGHQMPLGGGLRAWACSMPARYVPGNVWHVVGRLYLGSRLGARIETLLATSAVEQVLTVLGAVLVGLALGLSDRAAAWRPGLALVAGLGLIAIHPKVLGAALGLAGRLLGKRPEPVRLSYRDLALALGWYVLANLVSGVAFWLLVLSLGGAGPQHLLRLIGAYALAYAVGYLSFLTPAGLGAREAALVALLGGLGASPVAVAASLLARAASALGEALGVAALGLISARSIVGPKGRPDSC